MTKIFFKMLFDLGNNLKIKERGFKPPFLRCYTISKIGKVDGFLYFSSSVCTARRILKQKISGLLFILFDR